MGIERSKVFGSENIFADNIVVEDISMEFPSKTSGFAITSNGNAVALSTDRVTWTVKTMPSSQDWLLAAGDGMLSAIGYNSNIAAWSANGANWDMGQLPQTGNWSYPLYHEGEYVSVGYGSNSSIKSNNGVLWTVGTLPSAAYWSALTYFNGKYISIAYNTNASAYSTDGLNWTYNPVIQGRWKSLAASDTTVITNAWNNRVGMRSTDGIIWDTTTLPISSGWDYNAYGNGIFINITTSYRDVAVSTDGLAWELGTQLPEAKDWAGITFCDGHFIVSSKTECDYYYSTTDGFNWVKESLPVSLSWGRMTYGYNIFPIPKYESLSSQITSITSSSHGPIPGDGFDGDVWLTYTE